jgi:hypothetical protein
MDQFEDIARYNGDGILKITEKEIPCKFRIVQSGNGSIILECAIRNDHLPPGNYPRNADSFYGDTAEGWKINTDGELIGTGIKLSSEKEYQCLIFQVRYIQAVISADEEPDKISFGITNFEFFGTETVETRDSTTEIYSRSAMDLVLEGETIRIEQVNKYGEIVKYIKSSKNSRVTCQLVMKLPEDGLEKGKEIANSLCYLMSIVRGTKIAWIYINIFCGDKIISKIHMHGITKRYSSIPLFDETWDAGKTVRDFLQDSYGTYKARCDSYQLNRGTIDAYLDAKAQGDFLEIRGAKLAVAMEMLKSAFINAEDSVETPPTKTHVGEYIIDKTEFDDIHRRGIQKLLKTYFKEHGIKSDLRSKIYRNIQCINRTSFEDLLICLWEEIGLDINEQDICLFINSRNALIHQGKFYCKSKGSDSKYMPLPNQIEEYHFIVNILDKTILRLVGYSGSYINCRGYQIDQIYAKLR